MQTIKLDAQVDPDGVLRVELPADIANAELEVLVVYQRKTKRGWPVGYFDETAGSLANDPLERPPQGDYELRDSLASASSRTTHGSSVA